MEDLGTDKYNRSARAIEEEIEHFEIARGLEIDGPKLSTSVDNSKEASGKKVQSTVSKEQGQDEADALEPNAPSLQELEQNDSIIRDLRDGKLCNGEEMQRKKRRVCKHFLQKKCKHGKHGEKCDFEHPKMCFRFSKFGEKHPGGCKKGKKCQFYHPPLCWKSVNGEKCERKNCKFFHIRVPRVADKSVGESKDKNRNAEIQPSWARIVDPNLNRTKPMERPWSVADNVSGRDIQRDQIHMEDFLGIKKELHDLRMQIDRLMRLAEDTRGRAAPGSCSCH